MENNVSTIWNNCLQFIKENIPASSYRTWFAPIVPLKVDSHILTIQVPSAFFYEYLEENYIVLLRTALQRYLGKEAKLEYTIVVDAGRQPSMQRSYRGYGKNGNMSVPNQNNSAKPYVPYQQGVYTFPGKISSHPENQTVNSNYGASFPEPAIHNPFVIPGIKKMTVNPQLNPNYTIDNFVEGECNRLGKSAAVSIAKKPGSQFNPLLIFGKSGLGKTHLAQAIGNSVKEFYPDKLVLYVEANKFQTQYADACRNNTRNDFIHFYQMLDLLIIDDVQEFADKKGTQDTFFAIFNSLHQSGKQIILTCDTEPAELKGLSERLLSRFRWGLTVEVHVPDYETRLNILQKKVYNDGMNISDDILRYIAQTVVSNVRELEGALISLLAQSTFTRAELTLEVAKQLLGKIIKETEPEYSIDFIVNTVCDYFKIKEAVLYSKSRAKDIVMARQLAMYYSKKFTDLPYQVIGTQIGGRDHSTVLHACKAVAKSIENDEKYRDVALAVEAEIKTGSYKRQ